MEKFRKMETTKKAYKDILRLLDKYKNEVIFDVKQLEEQANNHLFGIELVEKYGFDIDPKKIYNPTYQKLKEDIHIGFWNGVTSKISWSDDGRQPKDEYLLYISFPTGAYIFGGDYPTEFFQKFFLELKSYGPKYVDTANKSLYFDLKNAGKIFNEYDSIIERYYKENEKDIKLRKIEQMKKDLAKLEAQ